MEYHSNYLPRFRGLVNRFDILSEITLTNEIKNYTHIRIKIRKEDKDYFYSKKVFNILYS